MLENGEHNYNKARSLHDYVMHDLKMEQINGGIINWDWCTIIHHFDNPFDVLIILGLSLKKLFDLTAKIQTLEKLNKTDHRDIQINPEEFNGEPISVLHSMVREEQTQVFKQPTLIYPVTL